jgi:hypothetical protein
VLIKAGMQTRTAEQFCFLRVEDAVRIISGKIEITSCSLESLQFLLKGLRFIVRPGHPGFEVFEAFRNRIRKQLRIGRLIAAHDQPFGFDTVGWIDNFRFAHL